MAPCAPWTGLPGGCSGLGVTRGWVGSFRRGCGSPAQLVVELAGGNIVWPGPSCSSSCGVLGGTGEAWPGPQGFAVPPGR